MQLKVSKLGDILCVCYCAIYGIIRGMSIVINQLIYHLHVIIHSLKCIIFFCNYECVHLHNMTCFFGSIAVLKLKKQEIYV